MKCGILHDIRFPQPQKKMNETYLQISHHNIKYRFLVRAKIIEKRNQSKKLKFHRKIQIKYTHTPTQTN